MNSEEFRETFLRSDREGPTKAEMARKMVENNVWGNEVAKAGTEDPQDRRSEAGKVKAESSLEHRKPRSCVSGGGSSRLGGSKQK